MAALVCAICGEHVHVDLEKIEEFVPKRIWGIKADQGIHYCGHESVFARGEPIYSAFLYNKGDIEAELLSKVELSKWKGKVHFHFLEEGVQNREEFKKILHELLNEIKAILKNPKIIDKEDKIRLIVQDKLEGYREIIELGKFELERGKYVKK